MAWSDGSLFSSYKQQCASRSVLACEGYGGGIINKSKKGSRKLIRLRRSILSQPLFLPIYPTLKICGNATQQSAEGPHLRAVLGAVL